MEERLYTTQEVAQELSVSDAHVRRLIGKGKAHPKQQIGGTWMFTLEEIERLRHRKSTRGPDKGKGGRPKKTS
jgi:excisionase family DNA binding protein